MTTRLAARLHSGTMEGVTPLEQFEEQRPRLFGIAYRMLGSVAEAEDVVQEAWLRWNGATGVEDAAAFLTTVVTRLSINVLESARVTRESYIGPWLPEPVDTSNDPLLGAERAEALELAVLLLLERLTPVERAAFVLHEAFAYPHRRIAEVLDVSESNARQLASRARRRIDSDRGRIASPAERDRLLAAFVAALQAGDVAGLEAVLVEDAVSVSDGGGVVSAARNVVTGRARVAALLAGLVAKYGADIRVQPVLANGEVATLAIRGDEPLALWTFDFAPEGVRRFLIVLNPHKLSAYRAYATSA